MSDEKTEEPTEGKLEKSLEKGQVPKSEDLTHAIAMLGTLAALLIFGDRAWDQMRVLMHRALTFGNGDMSIVELYKRAGAMAVDGLLISLPLVLAAAFFAAAGALIQVGVMFAPKAIEPDFDKLNPSNGFKKIFSARSVLTFVQLLVKATVLGVALWQVSLALVPLLAAATHQSVSNIAELAWHVIQKLLAVSLLLFLALGPVDYAIQRWQFMREQRMSKDEVKREYKENEGDPMIKGQRRQLAEEMAFSSPKKTIAGANAVIVNPTHYAVAIHYQRGVSALPTVVAKGMDEAAIRIRQLAEQEGVPIVGNPPLARALFKVETDHPIPEELFDAVAAVLTWVESVGARNNV